MSRFMGKIERFIKKLFVMLLIIAWVNLPVMNPLYSGNKKAWADSTDRLLELLKRKGVLTEEERSSIKQELIQEEMREKERIETLSQRLAQETKRNDELKKKVEESVAGEILAGYADKEFFIKDREENFVIHPVGRVQGDYRLLEDGAKQFRNGSDLDTHFRIRRARLGLEGTLWKSYDFKMEGEFGEGANDVNNLTDAYLNIKWFPNAELRIGQFKEPFCYEELTSSRFIDFIERSMVTNALAPARDIGLMIHGKPFGKMLEYGLGIFNGEGQSKINQDNNDDMEYAGRFVVYPFMQTNSPWLKNLSLGVSGTFSGAQKRDFGFRQRTAEGFEFFPRLAVDGQRTRVGGEFAWLFGPFSLKAEYMRGEEERNNLSPKDIFGNATDLDDVVADGFYITGSWLLTGEEKKSKMDHGVELALRYEQLNVDADDRFDTGFKDERGNSIFAEDNDTWGITAGLNWFVNYHVRISANYIHYEFDKDFFNPDSFIRKGVLRRGDDSADMFFVRAQIFW